MTKFVLLKVTLSSLTVKDIEKTATLLHLHRYQEALETIETVTKNGIQTKYGVIAYAQKASALFALERYVEALELYAAILHLETRYYYIQWTKKTIETQLNFAIASTLTMLDNPEEAMEFIDKGLKADPKNAVEHSNRASLLLTLGRPEQAMDSVLLAERLDPDLPGT
jgi:tetratricopeptide (TPR) repeat protein